MVVRFSRQLDPEHDAFLFFESFLDLLLRLRESPLLFESLRSRLGDFGSAVLGFDDCTPLISSTLFFPGDSDLCCSSSNLSADFSGPPMFVLFAF